jgi:coenzyme F420-0:L-glutamate ligase / coenzyme F420-1:gamma-L-glutamate ligase
MNAAAVDGLSLLPVRGLPEVMPGDDLAALLDAGLRAVPLAPLQRGDALVLAQKIVSKAENRYVELASVTPGAEAQSIAARCGKDARLVELVLRESSEVLRVAPGVLIVRHRLGFVLANAGIDRSNLPSDRAGQVLLLPQDPDASAQHLRQQLHTASGFAPAVLIADSFGRAWRLGVCGTCIGSAGLRPLLDLRGVPDRGGRPLEITQLALADQICAAAGLVSGEAAEGIPAVLVRGLPPAWFDDAAPGAHALLRPVEQDLFR